MVSSEICTKVYVGGIPYYSTEDDIRSYFESCGTVTEIDCMSFPESGKFRGIAIIGFKVSFFCILYYSKPFRNGCFMPHGFTEQENL